MENFLIFLSIAGGVAISIILPIIRVLLPKPKVAGLSKLNEKSRTWQILRPYIITGIFSTIVAVLIMAFAGELINTWQEGILAGYTSDSTMQKLRDPSKPE